MAEFTKKGSKGAVGTLTKAEGLGGVHVTKNGTKVDLTILAQEVPKDLDTLTEEIKVSHKEALGQVGRAVIAAARAGQLLLGAKVALPKEKNFTDWLAETFDFSQRTAYNYMKVAEAMSRRASEIESCESIRDVLKLCDAEDVSKKNKKDKKQESFVTHAAKIERWFADEKEKQPVEDWSKERVEGVIRMLTGVTNIVDILKAQL
jgi:hypothetical protein